MEKSNQKAVYYQTAQLAQSITYVKKSLKFSLYWCFFTEYILKFA